MARALPMQILDHASGYLIALGACAALLRQQREGGSWHVQVSLAATAQWLPEGAFGYNPRVRPRAYDPEGAKRLLAEAGYGQGFGVTLDCVNVAWREAVCQAATAMLAGASAS